MRRLNDEIPNDCNVLYGVCVTSFPLVPTCSGWIISEVISFYTANMIGLYSSLSPLLAMCIALWFDYKKEEVK